jgi:hypothetical protein
MLLHATYVSEFIGCTSSKILVGKRSEWAVSFFNSIEYKFIVSCNMHISFGRLNDAFQMEIPSGFKSLAASRTSIRSPLVVPNPCACNTNGNRE